MLTQKYFIQELLPILIDTGYVISLITATGIITVIVFIYVLPKIIKYLQKEQ